MVSTQLAGKVTEPAADAQTMKNNLDDGPYSAKSDGMGF